MLELLPYGRSGNAQAVFCLFQAVAQYIIIIIKNWLWYMTSYTMDHNTNMVGVCISQNSQGAQVLQIFGCFFYYLIKQLFHLHLLSRYEIVTGMANSVLRASLAVYHLISTCTCAIIVNYLIYVKHTILPKFSYTLHEESCNLTQYNA